MQLCVLCVLPLVLLSVFFGYLVWDGEQVDARLHVREYTAFASKGEAECSDDNDCWIRWTFVLPDNQTCVSTTIDGLSYRNLGDARATERNRIKHTFTLYDTGCPTSNARCMGELEMMYCVDAANAARMPQDLIMICVMFVVHGVVLYKTDILQARPVVVETTPEQQSLLFSHDYGTLSV